MELTARTSGVPASGGGDHLPVNDISNSRATRYLSAAAHLRRPMLPAEVTDPGTFDARAPLPVGRAYALRVLLSPGGVVPMSAVDMRMVRKHCFIALLQTVIRDLAAIGVVAAGVVIEPWGTPIILGIVLAAAFFAGRARFFLPLMTAAAVFLALALVNGSHSERVSLGIPAACLAGCFIIYLADVLLSIHYVRRIWRQPVRQQESRSVRGARLRGRVLSFREPARSEYQRWLYAGGNGYGSNGYGSNGYGSNGHGDYEPDPDDYDEDRVVPSVSGPDKIYYGKNGIIGAGDPRQALALTVPLDKPLDKDRDIEAFSASDLIEEISNHLLSQSVGDARVHGYAYQPLSADGTGLDPHDPAHFTYALPNLDVAIVTATPIPEPSRFPGVPVEFFRLNYRSRPSGEDMLDLVNRSPSEHPERQYVRASTSNWDGQLVTTVFVSVALQGHYLRVVMRPYVLAPVVFELSAADELARWNPLILSYLAVSVTIRQFLDAVGRLNHINVEPARSGGTGPSRSGLRSTRERYARPYVNNIHQADDSARAVEVIEEKAFKATMNFLRKRNIDINDYEKQIQNIIYNNVVNGNGNVTGSTFTNSPVANASGQGNTASNTNTTNTNAKT